MIRIDPLLKISESMSVFCQAY